MFGCYDDLEILNKIWYGTFEYYDLIIFFFFWFVFIFIFISFFLVDEGWHFSGSSNIACSYIVIVIQISLEALDAFWTAGTDYDLDTFLAYGLFDLLCTWSDFFFFLCIVSSLKFISTLRFVIDLNFRWINHVTYKLHFTQFSIFMPNCMNFFSHTIFFCFISEV